MSSLAWHRGPVWRCPAGQRRRQGRAEDGLGRLPPRRRLNAMTAAPRMSCTSSAGTVLDISSVQYAERLRIPSLAPNALGEECAVAPSRGRSTRHTNSAFPTASPGARLVGLSHRGGPDSWSTPARGGPVRRHNGTSSGACWPALPPQRLPTSRRLPERRGNLSHSSTESRRASTPQTLMMMIAAKRALTYTVGLPDLLSLPGLVLILEPLVSPDGMATT